MIPRPIVAASLGLALACGPQVGMPQAETDEPTTTGGDPVESTSAGPSPATSSTTGDGESGFGTAYEDDGGLPGCSFTCPPVPPGGGGGGGVAFECNLYLDDCRRGEKCMPWANDGGPLPNATRCGPLADPADAPGEACTFAGTPLSGIDSCAAGSICVPDEGARPDAGVCAALCSTGCPDPIDSCVALFDGVLPLCTHACDPLAVDACDPGWTCAARQLPPAPATFVCQPRLSPPSSAAYDPCPWPTACASGTFCGPMTSVRYDVCRPLCDASAPMPLDPCSDLGYACTPLDVAGTQWDGLGACSD